jgi:hypothetical protein
MLIAVLCVLEIAVLGEMGVAIRGGSSAQAAPWFAQHVNAPFAPGPHLIEGGPHRLFDPGSQPALTVDIGYADLTIVARSVPQIDASVSKSSDFGFMRSKAPIQAEQDGAGVHISAADTTGFSTGDNRMVTVIVPPNTQVTVVSAGDISVSGLRAEASIHSRGNGSITVEDFSAPSLRLTSSGPISMHEVTATRLDATSTDDKIDAAELQVHGGVIEGDDAVTLGFAPGTDTVVNASTSDGKIHLSGFPADAGPASSNDGDAETQSIRVGAGGGHLDVHSSDDDVALSQQG